MEETAKVIANLVSDFSSVVRHRQASEAEAVAALLAAATAILVRDFGEVAAAELLRSMLDEAAASWRAQQCAGSC